MIVRETKKRRCHPPEYQAKVGLEAVPSGKTINQIGQEFDVRTHAIDPSPPHSIIV